MVDGMIISVLMIVFFIAIRYIVKEKARGRRCIGCPANGKCASCHCDDKKEILNASAV